MSNIKLFLLGSLKELKDKVSWPSYKSAQKSTALVLVATIIFALIVGFMDIFFKKLVSYLYGSL